MGRRATILEKLGLSHIETDAIDLNDYLARRAVEDRAGETIAARSESSIGPAGATSSAPAESSTPGSSGSAGAALTDSPEPRDADSEGTDTDPHEGA
jgi:hypothetical protein